MKTKLPHIGIFWVYKSTVLAKAMPLNSTEPDSLSLYDSDFSHLVEWEEHRIYLRVFLSSLLLNIKKSAGVE